MLANTDQKKTEAACSEVVAELESQLVLFPANPSRCSGTGQCQPKNPKLNQLVGLRVLSLTFTRSAAVQVILWKQVDLFT